MLFYGERDGSDEAKGERIRVGIGKEASPSIRDDDECASHSIITVVGRVRRNLSRRELEDFAIREGSQYVWDILIHLMSQEMGISEPEDIDGHGSNVVTYEREEVYDVG